jgi:hypothetical protein
VFQEYRHDPVRLDGDIDDDPDNPITQLGYRRQALFQFRIDRVRRDDFG